MQRIKTIRCISSFFFQHQGHFNIKSGNFRYSFGMLGFCLRNIQDIGVPTPTKYTIYWEIITKFHLFLQVEGDVAAVPHPMLQAERDVVAVAHPIQRAERDVVAVAHPIQRAERDVVAIAHPMLQAERDVVAVAHPMLQAERDVVVVAHPMR